LADATVLIVAPFIIGDGKSFQRIPVQSRANRLPPIRIDAMFRKSI
jgi:hypothetical protein